MADNPYDAIAADMAAPGPKAPGPAPMPGAVAPPTANDNPYDAIAADMFAPQRNVAAGTIGMWGGEDADKANLRQRQAKALGLPAETVRNQQAEADRQSRVQQAQRDLEGAPNAQRHLAKPENAAIAHDDTANLGMVERLLNGMAAVNPIAGAALAGQKAGAWLVDKGPQAARDIYDMGPQGALGIAQNFGVGAVNLISDVALTGGAFVTDLADFIVPVRGVMSALGGPDVPYKDLPLVKARQAVRDWAKNAAPQGESIVAKGIYSGAQSMPVTIGAAAVSFVTGNPQAGAAFAGLSAGLTGYSEAREAGMGFSGAFNKSAIDAVIEYGTEVLPQKFLLDDVIGKKGWGKVIWDQMWTEQIGEQFATLGQDFNQWVSIDRNKGKSFDDYAGEIVEHAIITSIATGVMVGGSTATSYVASKAIDRAVQRDQARQISDAQGMLGSLFKLAQASELQTRNPASFAEFVASAAEGSPVETVYVSRDTLAEAFAQTSLEPEQQAAIAQLIAPHVAVAEQTGSDVAIPIGDFTAAIAGTGAETLLLPELRTDPLGMTMREADTFMQEEGTAFRDEVNAALDRARTDDATRADLDEIKANLQGMLSATGKFTTRAQEAKADMVVAMYATMAERAGITAKELYARMPLTVQRAADAQSQPMHARFGQNAPRPPIPPSERMTPEDVVRELGRLSNEAVPGGHPNSPHLGLQGGSFPGLGTITMDEDGNVVLTRVADDDQHLTKYGEVTDERPFDFAELMRTSLHHGGGRGVPTSGLTSWTEQFRSTRPGVVGTFRIPPRELLDLVRNGEAIIGNLGEGEIVLSPDAAARYLTEIDGKAVRRVPDRTGVETGVDMPTSLAEAVQLATAGSFKTGRDLKVALQEMSLAAQRAAGIDLTTLDPENIDRLADFLFEDAVEAVQDNSNAIGWYDRAVTAAKNELQRLHPELVPGSEAEFAFTWALAVTSNGLKVNKNFELANTAYEAWKAGNGNFPEDIGIGEAAQKINEGLGLYIEMIEHFGSWQALRDFMVSQHTVRDIEKMSGLKVSGEGKNTIVRGAAILGPKIGNGFFSNLYGHFDGLTMDRWLVRSVGRWRGTLIERNEEMIGTKRGQIKAHIATLTPAERNILRKMFEGSEVKLGSRMTAAEVDALAVETAKRSQDKGWRAAINKLEGGETMRTLGNGLAKYLDGQVEQPAGANERAFLRKVFTRGLEKLRQQPGMESLTMADLQALIWYPEKLLYEAAKKPEGEGVPPYEDDEAPDYANAARRLVDNRLGPAGRGGPDVGGAGRTGPAGGTTDGGETLAQGATGAAQTGTRGAATGQTDSPEFKAWFGNSKVTDDQGQPLVVYHGSLADFSEFNPNSHFGTAEQAAIRVEGKAGLSDAFRTGREPRAADQTPVTYPVYLSIQNPMRVRDFLEDEDHRWREVVAQAKAAGHDGLVYKNIGEVGPDGEATDSYVAFYPEQIKSAIANTGAFSPTNPDILYQEATGFFSPLERAIESHPAEAMTGAQWSAAILEPGTTRKVAIRDEIEEPGFDKEGNPKIKRRQVPKLDEQGQPMFETKQVQPRPLLPGVKIDEITSMGLLEWLEGMGDTVVQRDELLAFVREGGVQVHEVMLGGVREDTISERVWELQDEWVAQQMEDWEFDDSFVPYPRVVEVPAEEDGGQTYWKVEGSFDLFDSEEAAREQADADHEANVEAEEEEARRSAEEDHRDDVPDFYDQATEELGGAVKFSGWTLEEGFQTGYRELLLTLPEGVGGNPETAFYHPNHYNDQPVIAHIRFNLRKTPDGRDVMFIEEIQSDWHQRGLKKGYNTGRTAEEQARYEQLEAMWPEVQANVQAKAQDLVKAWLDAGAPGAMPGEAERYARNLEYDIAATMPGVFNEKAESIDRNLMADRGGVTYAAVVDEVRAYREAVGYRADVINDLSEMRQKEQDLIPDAPFKASWPTLAMKRAIRWAADNGIETVAWTTGAQQAKRYGLSRAVGSISAEQRDDGRYRVQFGNQYATDFVIDQGFAERVPTSVSFISDLVMSADQLEKAFGPEVAKRVVEGVAETSSDPAKRETALREATEMLDAAIIAKDTYRADLERAWIKQEMAKGDETLSVIENTASGRSIVNLATDLGYHAGATVAEYTDLEGEVFEARARVNDARKGAPFVLADEGLEIGGQGMRGFYDRNLVNMANNLLKPHGAKVEMLKVEGLDPAQQSPEDVAAYKAAAETAKTTRRMLLPLDISLSPSLFEESYAEALLKAEEDVERIKDYMGTETENVSSWAGLLEKAQDKLYLISDKETIKSAVDMHYAATQTMDEIESREVTSPGFTIPPSLKTQAQQGFALFQNPARALGSFQPSTNLITLFDGTNLSTFLHESGHFFLEVLRTLAEDPNAPQQIKDDWAAALKWFGVTADEWRGFTLNEQRPYHEKWARSFEAYLYRGKAPSLETQRLFTTFRGWLVSIYKRVRAIGHVPPKTIRGVFDRMLATDDAIATMEAQRSMLPLFETQAKAGIDPLAWAEYQRQHRDATDDAVRELDARSQTDMRWVDNVFGRELNKLKKLAKIYRKEIRAQVADEVAHEPVYAARLYMTRGELEGQPVEGPTKISIPELEALYGEDTAAVEVVKRALGYGKYGMLSRDNGLHPEQVAELFGFTSADHLIRSVMEAEEMGAKIDGLTEQRMLEQHGELVGDEALRKAAAAAVHNEARSRFVATELNMLSKLAGKPKTLATAAKNFARETIGRLKVRNLTPSTYEAAAARAAKEAARLVRENKLVEAAVEKRNQLINLEMARAAHRTREQVERKVASLRRLSRPGAAKTIDGKALEQIWTLLEAVDLRRGTTLRSIDSANSLATWIEAQRAMGLEPVITPEMAAALGRGTSYKEMTVDELMGLVDAIENIVHLGKLKKKLLTAKKNREIAIAVAAIADTVEANAVSERGVRLEGPRTTWQRATKGWYEFLAMHRKFASLIRQMDGFKDGGVIWEYLVRPANAAGDKEATMRAEATARLAEILKPVITKKVTTIGKTPINQHVFIPEIGGSLSLEGRIAIALNMGNSTNRLRVLEGDGWTQAQLDAVLATLTAEHWGIVQQVWDYVGSYWPQIASKEQRVTGLTPEQVAAEPFTVTTADGVTIDMTGGYYPIKYDPSRSTRAEADNAADIASQMMRGLYSRATTRRGHTKERVASVKRPVRKDLGVVFQHLTEVIHDLAWHEYLIDANRLLGHAKVDAAIRQYYGPEVLKALTSAVTDMAAGEVPAANSWERGVNYLRTGMTVAGMGWSLSTALLQPLGLTQSVKRIGLKWVARGMTRWGSDAQGMERGLKWIHEQSPFMATRAQTMQREISEIQNQITKQGGTISTLQGTFFSMIQKTQMVADIPTWVGQYEKSIDAGEQHDRAVAIADQAVIDAQGGGGIKDLAAIQRGGPLQKLWTNFYSYFSTTYNLAAESVGEARLTGNKSKLAVDAFLLFLLPTLLGYIIRSGLKGDIPDDPEELAKALGLEGVGYLFATMVGLRDVGGAITYGSDAPAGMGALGKVSKFAKQVKQGEVDAALLRSANQLAGTLFHYPASQVQRTVEGAYALAKGKTKNPVALFLGPSQEARTK